jgi:hypothetical protein
MQFRMEKIQEYDPLARPRKIRQDNIKMVKSV